MYLIQEFWFVAVAAADQDRDLARGADFLGEQVDLGGPICSVFAWLMNRWLGQVTSEVERNHLIPAACALANEGQKGAGVVAGNDDRRRLGGDGRLDRRIWAAAVSTVPLLTTSLSPIFARDSLPPWSPMNLVRVERILRDEVDGLPLFEGGRRCGRGRPCYGNQ